MPTPNRSKRPAGQGDGNLLRSFELALEAFSRVLGLWWQLGTKRAVWTGFQGCKPIIFNCFNDLRRTQGTLWFRKSGVQIPSPTPSFR